MTYSLSNDEPVAEGVRRVVREEIALAKNGLKARRVQDRDEAIHEARKSVKKVRSVLRLVRPVLGEIYVREAAEWKETGRKLSDLRDAGAIIGVYDEIRERYGEEVPASVRRNLVASKRKLEKAANVRCVLAGVASGLERAEGRLKRWPLTGEGFPVISEGLRVTYREGEKALRRAQRRPSTESLHDLRKCVKAHLYQIRLLEGLWDRELRLDERRLTKMETALGDHHNLAVLKTKILGSNGVDDFLGFVDKRSSQLARRALGLGILIYRKSPGKITKRLGKLWQEWAK
jgi:CHAD domain-containing protein